MTTLDEKLKAAINGVLRKERPELRVLDADGMVLRKTWHGTFAIELKSYWHEPDGSIYDEAMRLVRPGAPPPTDK